MRCGVYYEKKFKVKGYKVIIGIDEAGRGPLAGPVVAAAVALRKDSFASRIDDSKKLTPRQREDAFPEIVKKSYFAIGIADQAVIDRVNILQATRLAMEEAVKKLIDNLEGRGSSAYLLVDGDVKLRLGLPFANIIKGDAKSKSIAAASIIAKVTRDRIMSSYDKLYPQYGFRRHKGYPTKEHRSALHRFGPCAIHRKSFCGV